MALPDASPPSLADADADADAGPRPAPPPDADADADPRPAPPPDADADADPRPRTPCLPYNPIRRTPPTSVLVPFTAAELQIYKTPRHALRIPARPTAHTAPNHLKRQRDDDDDDDLAERPAKRSYAGLVVEHYNARPDVGVVERDESPIIGLKKFNNWIKTVLMSKFAKPAFYARTTRGAPRRRILDMGCGKGGDLKKWQRLGTREYVGLDIAAVSVEQAQARYSGLRGRRSFNAAFAALDCYTSPLSAALPPRTLTLPFDVVSMQFCMHYAFDSAEKVRMMLQNVTQYLRPGGAFIGTIPNAKLLRERLDALPPDAPPTFGNDVYRIRFEDRNTPAEFYGHRYWFYLKDAVEDVPEYAVEWDHFEELARDYGLHLVYKMEFPEVLQAERNHPDHGSALILMNVVSDSGESQMDEDQWEAASIYLAFAFKKR